MLLWLNLWLLSANGSHIVLLNASDPDADPMRFDLVDDGGGPFSLSPIGELTVNTSKGWLDYELKELYTVKLSLREVSNAISNASLLYATQGNVTLQIRVTDVNEAPYFSVLPSGYRLREESPVFTRAVPTTAGALGGYSIVVNDEDFGDNSVLVVACVSSSVGFGEAYFEVVSSATNSTCRGGQQCALRLRGDSTRIDYDAGLRSINVTLTVTDSLSLSSTSSKFLVMVDDVNQGIVFPGFGRLSLMYALSPLVAFAGILCVCQARHSCSSRLSQLLLPRTGSFCRLSGQLLYDCFSFVLSWR